jgi:hypothetical protein
MKETEVTKKIYEIVETPEAQQILSVVSGIQKITGIPLVDSILVNVVNKIAEKYKNNQVKNDILKTKEGKKSFKILFDYLRTEQLPDETVFSILQTILFKMLSGDIESSDKATLFMEIISKLDEYDIRIIMGAYAFYKDKSMHMTSSTAIWATNVLQKSGLPYIQIITLHSEKLMNMGLLDKFSYSDNSGIESPQTARLTELGIAICSFIEQYKLKPGKL